MVDNKLGCFLADSQISIDTIVAHFKTKMLHDNIYILYE